MTYHRSMLLIGDHVTLHRNTVCDLSAPGVPYDKARCTVLSFNPRKSRWHVRLQGDQGDDWHGKTKYVLESQLSLGFAVLPENAHPKLHVKVPTDDMDDSCGRGLLVQQAVRAGQPLFTESPLMVVATAAADPQRNSNQRFLAYQSLALDAAAAAALDAFEDLTPDGLVPSHVSIGAEVILAQNSPEAMTTEMREGSLETLTNILMRFEVNQFGFSNGEASGDDSFNASALYAFSSRLNHSCAPSVTIMSKQR